MKFRTDNKTSSQSTKPGQPARQGVRLASPAKSKLGNKKLRLIWSREFEILLIAIITINETDTA